MRIASTNKIMMSACKWKSERESVSDSNRPQCQHILIDDILHFESAIVCIISSSADANRTYNSNKSIESNDFPFCSEIWTIFFFEIIIFVVSAWVDRCLNSTKKKDNFFFNFIKHERIKSMRTKKLKMTVKRSFWKRQKLATLISTDQLNWLADE